MQLFINTYGTYIHVKDNLFEIKAKTEDGEKKHHYAASKVTSIIMSPGCAFSSDAVKLAIENNIDIVFVEYNGKPLGRVWHSKLGSTTKIRKAQLHVSTSKTGLEYIKRWLDRKLNNEADFIKNLIRHRSDKKEILAEKAEGILEMNKKIQSVEADSEIACNDSIRGFEGNAGRLFFEAVSFCMPKMWQFDGRSTRPAKDAFNVFLNYTFGILYSRVEKALIIAGIDPYIGFLHRDDYNQLSFVFDFIEPYRIWAVEVVFRLFSGKKVKKSHIDEIHNGVRLNKEGKVLLMPAFVKFFDETRIRYKGRNLIRSHIMQLDAHSFANELIGTKTNKIPELITF